ncbi:tRNA (adenosine(37)-N6)-threonylcarbamoyltransferase complex ATPase subunit type 1 TsaE [Geminicoccaceae bacterium 1502E]|nr:tRNA (adenosine(37)-N6)-threonylcarbamoyltransferase complex ATPase subunit type 1 TsaE [Geminicoccaceae bacterium 1502E]
MAGTVLVVEDLAASRAFAARLAALLRPGDLVCLEGDLGAGKSELARAVIRARAGAPIEVPSPTFTLVQHYDLPDLKLAHADLYRVSDPGEVEELGLDEVLREGALLVEWAERAGAALPADRLVLRLEAPDPDRPERRLLTVEPPSGDDRFAALLP